MEQLVGDHQTEAMYTAHLDCLRCVRNILFLLIAKFSFVETLLLIRVMCMIGLLRDYDLIENSCFYHHAFILLTKLKIKYSCYNGKMHTFVCEFRSFDIGK